MSLRTSILFLSLAFATSGANAAPATDNATPGIVVSQIQDNQTTISVNWFLWCYKRASCQETVITANFPKITPDSVKSPEATSKVRINSDTVVILHVTNFNFLNYQIRYNVEEEVVEAYQTLEKLWAQILGLGAQFAIPGGIGLAGVESESAYIAAYNRWFDQLQIDRDRLETVLRRDARRVVLRKGETEAIEADRSTYDITIRDNLQRLRQAARRLATSLDTLAHFQRADEDHQAFMSSIDLFVAAANLTVNGQRRVIGKRKSGTIITATMAPIRITGATQDEETIPVISFEYFVHSTLPLLFHMGYSESFLSGDQTFQDFERVRALGNSDVYAQIRNEDTKGDFSAFLSYEIVTFDDKANFSVLATLGTALSDPGSTFFVGASIKIFDRFLISVGANSTQIADEGDAVIEQLGDTLQTRELFDTISRRRAWGSFLGLSFRVF